MKKIISNFFIFGFILLNINSSFAQNMGDYETPSVTDNCINLTVNLKLKSKDSKTNGEVSDLQSFLQDRNLLNVEPNGYFGQATLNAVKSYQSSKGLAATGYVGQLTRSKISQDTCREDYLTSNTNVPPIANPITWPMPEVCRIGVTYVNGYVSPCECPLNSIRFQIPSIYASGSFKCETSSYVVYNITTAEVDQQIVNDYRNCISRGLVCPASGSQNTDNNSSQYTNNTYLYTNWNQ